MNSIFLKSAAVAFASVAASLLLTLIVVPAAYRLVEGLRGRLRGATS